MALNGEETQEAGIKSQPAVSILQLQQLWSDYLRYSAIWMETLKAFLGFLSKSVKLVIPFPACPFQNIIALQIEI